MPSDLLRARRRALTVMLVIAGSLLLSGASTRQAQTDTRVGVFPNTTRRSSDSAYTQEWMELRLSEFHAAWQRVWRISERYRQRYIASSSIATVRLSYQHCHADGRLDSGALPPDGVDASVIASNKFRVQPVSSKNSYYAVCPSWLLSQGVESASDERIDRDGAIIDSLRPQIRQARRVLLAELDSIALAFPGNVWLTGQRTRLYLDQADPMTAMNAAQSCRGEAWWCAALVGYVNARVGKTYAAESSFVEMHRVMPVKTACDWNDARQLLEGDGRSTYGKLDCANRDSVNKTLWWIADPLLRTRVNERRVEDDMRRVEIELHKALASDERYHWDDKMGGDAISLMLLRYGWPTYTANMISTAQFEKRHTGYLNMDSPLAHLTPYMAPYTTFEYVMDRAHTVPSWDMLQHPFAIKDTAWVLRAEDATGEPVMDWWPSEFFRGNRMLVQLFEGQTGMFRRQSQILLATSVQLKRAELVNTPRSLYDVMMLTSSGPGNLDSLAQSVDSAGSTIVMQGLISPTPRLVSIEALGVRNSEVNARSRFGITPPMPLDSMKAGEFAVSDPILLDVLEAAAAPNETLIARMLGSTALDPSQKRISIYWETYGLGPTDTVKVFVRVVGAQNVSVTRRLGMALNVADNPNAAIMQQWTEPDAQRSTRMLIGSVPVLMRSISLNLSQLAPGPYVLEVGVERKDGVMASGQRHITVQP